MKERPIIFSGEMVKALPPAGTKTQTRRLMKPQPNAEIHHIEWTGCPPDVKTNFAFWPKVHGLKFYRECPYGVAGDRLYVRETFYCDDYRYPDIPEKDQSDSSWREQMLYFRASDGDDCIPEGEAPVPWRPSIHMPRWASRITLEITKVRVERLQDISEEDAKAEGIIVPGVNPFSSGPGKWAADHPFKFNYSLLWDSLHGKGAWDKNAWVWILEFRRL